MAQNFKISVHRNFENLHLKLIGDFDEASAQNVANVLKRQTYGISKVFIHTGGITQVAECSRTVFYHQLDDFKRHSIPVIFTGKNAAQIAPGGTLMF